MTVRRREAKPPSWCPACNDRHFCKRHYVEYARRYGWARTGDGHRWVLGRGWWWPLAAGLLLWAGWKSGLIDRFSRGATGAEPPPAARVGAPRELGPLNRSR